MVRALAEEYGFGYAFFWPPNFWTGKKPLTEEEQRIQRGEFPPGDRVELALLRGLYDQVFALIGRAALEGPGFYSLADVFDNVPDQVYLPQQLTPEGNRLVARRMAELMGEPRARRISSGPTCGTDVSRRFRSPAAPPASP
jgi:hypothetical protein